MDIKELKKKSEAMDIVIDILAETGNKQMAYMQQSNKLNKKTQKILMNFNITDEQFDKFTNLLKQFEQMIDELIKEESIKEDSKDNE